MPKLFINNGHIAEDYFTDAKLVGIQCSLELQRFIWLVNSRFAYDFRCYPGTEVMVTKKGRLLRFLMFQCSEAHLEVDHFMYANQCEGEYLLPELKHYDYLWLMKGDLRSDDEFSTLLLAELKALDQVQLVTEIPNEKIISKEKLML